METHIRTRAYDPRTARWLQRDPVGAKGGHPNLYRYCQNDPINRADPDGTKPKSKAECDKLLDDIKAALDKAESELKKLVPEDAIGEFPYAGGTTKPLGHCEDAAGALNKAKNLWEEFVQGDCWKYYPDDPRPGSLSKRTDELSKMLESRISKVLKALERYVQEGKIKVEQAIDALKRLLPHVKRYGKKLERLIRHLIKKLAAAAVRKVPFVGWAFFAYDWYSGGFGHAVNEALWPLSELWD